MLNFSTFFLKFAKNGQMKSYLQVQNLSQSIGDRTLFEDISFSISQFQKVGLIAKNGEGKSTLLNIISGRDSTEAGEVIYHNDLRIGYLEQSPQYPMDLTVIEACFWHGNDVTNLIREYETCMSTPGNPHLQDILERMEHENAWDYERRSKTILSKLDIQDFDKPLCQLSGGQLKRVALANVLIMEPEFLILDEPTNHLDLIMIEWLESYLQNARITLLMVTHDRYFLDNVCNEIMELDDTQIFSYRGNYSYFLEKKEERIHAQQAEVARASNLYRTELEWMRRQPQARGHKARYREEAFSELEKVAKRRMEERQLRLEMKSTYIGQKIFEAAYVSKKYKHVILKDFYYNFSRFEKMGIVGGNGVGKSTFIKMLLGKVKPDSGRFIVGETVRFGYFSQEGMEFDEKMKVIDAVKRIAEYVDLGGGRHLSAMQFLEHFMFTPAQQQNYICKLSGGEKRRLYLCTVLMTSPNFLVLDEPTNDLDIQSLQILEAYLQDFQGCVIVVSHDRYFMDKVVDHLLVFQGEGVVVDFPGNYSQYRDYLELKEKEKKENAASSPAKKEARTTKPRTEKRKGLSYKAQRRYATLETDIADLESQRAEIHQKLSSGEISVEEIVELSKLLPKLDATLEEKSMQWLELDELKG